MAKRFSTLALICFLSFHSRASDTLTQDNTRLRLLKYSVAVAYPASMLWLYSEWYRPYRTSDFHFFNDNPEWEQMDKYSHIGATYMISKGLMHGFQWAGQDERTAMWTGAAVSYIFLTTIEVFDGFSDKWGFSWGDVACNTIGVASLVSQQLAWYEQRIVFKGSFHSTKYSQYRPALLGDGLPSTIIKDYNGMTYWASVNPYSFKKESGFPKWLSIAAGVGAEGMTGARENPSSVDGKEIPSFERYRQYYIGIDFDLARIETNSKALNILFKLINFIRLPAPAIEFNSGRSTKFYLLYF